jgi:hypothetical protein
MNWQTILKKKPKPESPRKKALKRARAKGLSGLNSPQRLKDHKTKSHHVYAWDGKNGKYITFGQKGADTVPESNPTGKRKKKQDSFKARHAKNIKRGKMSAAYWANKVKW